MTRPQLATHAGRRTSSLAVLGAAMLGVAALVLTMAATMLPAQANALAPQEDELDITDHGVAMYTPNVRLADVGVLADGTPVGYLFNDGHPVSLSMVDLSTGERLDRHEFDGYAMASAIVVDDDTGMVYLSVRSPNDGTLWSYDPQARELTELASGVAGEQMLRSLLIHDGTLYGSTYPSAKVYSYDLDTGDIHDYGSVAEDVSYAWGFAEVDDALWVGTGTTPFLREVDRQTGDITDRDLPADITDNADFITQLVRHEDLVFARYSPGGVSSVAMYDLAEAEWSTDIPALGTWTEESDDGAFYYIDGEEVRGFDLTERTDFDIGWEEAGMSELLPGTNSLHLLELGLPDYPGVSLVGIREDGGIWYYNLEDQSGEEVLADIEGAPATIQSMTVGPDGNPYIGAYLSVGVMARVHHETGEVEELDGPGQADALATLDDTLAVAGYPGAEYYAGDPSAEWQWGDNPEHLFTIGRSAGQDRTSDMIAAGDLIAAGTVPNYGENGGALVLFDPHSDQEPQVHRDVVPGQSVSALAYRDGLVYGGTSIHGGIDSTPAEGPAELFVWDVEAGDLVTSAPVDDDAQIIHSVAFDDQGRLWVMSDSGTMLEYDVEQHEVVGSTSTELTGANDWGRTSELAMHPENGLMYGNAANSLYALDPETAEVEPFGPEDIRYSAITADGTVY
ncbi:MAG TPA: hypothetical protein VK095_12960, partial [Beutenbergiaceae bacterium]|nr:hypothetical protein [Beutenbergiaceae bacterium]